MKSPPKQRPIDRIREQLDYRLPTSGKSMSTIVLPREVAEQLVSEWEELEARARVRS